jgi:hypothetical protein
MPIPSRRSSHRSTALNSIVARLSWALVPATAVSLGGGCAAVLGATPGDHPVWSQPLKPTPTPSAATATASTLTIELDDQMKFVNLRGVAVKLDGRLIRREMMASRPSPPPSASGEAVPAAYRTSLILEPQSSHHDVCVFVWYDGTDVLAGKQVMVTGERLVGGVGEAALQMRVRLEPPRQVDDSGWSEMIATDWAGGAPAGASLTNCGVDAPVVASPAGGIGYVPGFSSASLIPMLPPGPPGR